MNATTSVIETAPAKTASLAVTVSKPARIAAGVKIVGAVLLVGLLFPEWIKGGANGLSANGGGGFGILALITAVVASASAIRTLTGRSQESSIFGLNQLAGALGLATFLGNLVYLWVFTTGGAPKWVYVAANLIVYSSVVGLFSTGNPKASPLEPSAQRAISLATMVLGIGVMLAPALEYTKLSSTSFTGYEPGAPRIGILFLIVGGVTVLFGASRFFRSGSFVELGPYLLVPHATIGLGIVCFAPATAWLVSGLWGSTFSPGVGVYASVLLEQRSSRLVWPKQSFDSLPGSKPNVSATTSTLIKLNWSPLCPPT